MERERPVFVVADDDPDDRLLLKEAFQDCQEDVILHFLENSDELTEYLYRQGNDADSTPGLAPDLILLDLYPSRADGFEIIKTIMADPALAKIPTLVLTTFCEDEDIKRCYDLGVSAVIQKGSSYDQLVQTAKSIYDLWSKSMLG